MNFTPSKNWKTVRLGNIGRIVTGKTPSKNNPDDWGFGVPFITPTDISENSLFCIPARHLSEEGANRFRNLIIPKNTICYTCIASIGKMCLTTESSLANQQINSIIVDENRAYYKFIFYLLRYLTPQIISVAGGTMTSIINKTKFEDFEISLPSLGEQHELADMLGVLDDKIELLRRENKTLEATAQTLFKQWFVDFEFPNSEGKSYRSSGEKMVESELGEIPEGWGVGRLGDVGKVICGKTPPKSEPKYFGGRIPFIKIPDMHNQMFICKTEDNLTEAGANSQSRQYIPENSICVSCIATVGLVSITTEDSQTNQQINSVVPTNRNILEYLYFVLSSKKEDLEMIGAGGSATLNVNTGVFSNLEIVVPCNPALDSFHDIVDFHFRKIKLNFFEIKTLSSLRDNLLNKIFAD